MTDSLCSRLQDYGDSGCYPFHMPGHKRNTTKAKLPSWYSMDITEISGFDNLHHPQGILLEAQKRAACLYQAEESFFLVNGSTAGILSAMSVATEYGKKILIARNSHMSVYHAALIHNTALEYLYPRFNDEFDINEGITSEAVAKKLENRNDIGAVMITSPTYEGVNSDIRGIAEVVHKKGIPLILDQAHGAHLGFHPGYPDSGVKLGADLVIHSLHKTLPAPTQTALLHVQGDYIDRKALRRYLRIFQTSSPSYPLMAGIDLCLDIIREQGYELLEELLLRRRDFNNKIKKCRGIHLCDAIKDAAKAVISVKGTSLTGPELAEILRETYHLEMEMAAGSYVTAIFTIMDRQEGIDRLAEALIEIDGYLQPGGGKPGMSHKHHQHTLETVMGIKEAVTGSTRPVPPEAAAGEVAGEFISVYPPGIPIVVPGERMDALILKEIKRCCDAGLAVQGLSPGGEVTIRYYSGKLKEICNVERKTLSTIEFKSAQRTGGVNMRKTKIICTIGPASESEEKLKELIEAGMDVARFNFSHGTHQQHKEKIDRLYKVSNDMGVPVAALMDTKGPEIRLKSIAGGKAELVSGQTFILTTEEIEGNHEKVSITYHNLKNDINIGTTILIDDGLIEMIVESIEETEIICKVINGGVISNNKGVNVPGVILSMPYISETDLNDIIFGCEMGYDFLAASFTRSKEDVLQVRKIIEENNSNMKIIAKIENMQGLSNLDEILEAADGIMVARGDMGVEIPMEDVPVVQKEMIKKAENLGKHVITATQMLESMITHPRPTRAETTDVANAIYDGTTAIMLSGETAAGDYPVEAVRTMARIAERAERDINYDGRMKARGHQDNSDITTAISHATCTTASDLKAKAIITVTISGFTAGMISRYKPSCPIIACSVSPKACRQLNLFWGTTPLWIPREKNADDLFMEAVKAAERAGLVQKGDVVVLTAGVPLGVSGKTNMIRVIEVED